MAQRIEDYALIGDTHTAALVGKDGSIDWLCVPRFDSGSVFARCSAPPDHGRWLLAPAGGIRSVERQYRGDTLVLETTFHTDDGVARIIDCMPIRKHRRRHRADRRGRVGPGADPHGPPRALRLRHRAPVGAPPRRPHAASIAGANSMWLRTPVETTGAGYSTVADFVVARATRCRSCWRGTRRTSRSPHRGDTHNLLRETVTWWNQWSAQCTYRGEYRDLVDAVAASR